MSHILRPSMKLREGKIERERERDGERRGWTYVYNLDVQVLFTSSAGRKLGNKYLYWYATLAIDSIILTSHFIAASSQ